MLVLKTVVTLAIVMIAMSVQPSCAFVCECRTPPSPDEARDAATAVFAGRVINLAAPLDRGGPMPMQVTFAVSQGWKGADQPTMTIHTPASSASCGVEFRQGVEYLVYATTSDDQLHTALCSRTTTLASAQPDLDVLGSGHLITPSNGANIPSQLPTTGADASIWNKWTNLLSWSVLLIMFGVMLLVIQRRQRGAVTHEEHEQFRKLSGWRARRLRKDTHL